MRNDILTPEMCLKHPRLGIKGYGNDVGSLLVAHVHWNRDIPDFQGQYKPLFEATDAACAPLQRSYGAVIDTEGTLSAAFIRLIRLIRRRGAHQ